MEEFFTRERSNEGVKLPLSLPDGTRTEHWLRVRGIDSDQFKKAEAEAKREALELAQVEDKDKQDEMALQIDRKLISSLIAGWSFDKELTPENVINFLREAPQIADQVNRYAVRRSEFFAKKSDSSADG